MDTQLISIYLIYRSVEARFVRVAIPIIILLWIPLMLITHDSPNLLIFLFNLYLMSEIFYRYKLCTLRTNGVVSQASEPNSVLSLEAGSVLHGSPQIKTVLKRLMSHQQVIFALQRIGVAPVDVPFVDCDPASLLSESFQLAKTVNGQKITLVDILVGYLSLTEKNTHFLFSQKLKVDDLYRISLWTRMVYPHEEHKKGFHIASSGGGIGQWLISGWTLETKKYTQVFPQKNSNTDVSIVGREKEYQLLQEGLLKSERNNILLVGMTGTGKEQLLRKLAEDCYEGNTDKKIAYKIMLEVLVGSLLAGASQQGELQQRLKEIIEEVSHAGNVILYVPELQNLLGATSFSLDLSGALMPFLRDGKLPVVASVTEEDFKQYIQGKPIAEMFTDIHLEVPSQDMAELMIMEEVAEIEKASHCIVCYSAVKASVMYAGKYADSAELPGSAIDLLRDAIGKNIPEQQHNTHIKARLITDFDILRTVEIKTNIPLSEPSKEESSKLLNLEEVIHERIVGQDEAVKVIAESLRRVRSGIQNSNRPVSFLFLGPTGVGKTEVAKVLSNIYFGGEAHIVRLDMSEYADEMGLEKLIGSSSTSHRGELTEKIHDHPSSLILLDEFEKAHVTVLNLFLQVLDDGRLTDGRGVTISFSNTIIIATSNAGSELVYKTIEKNIPLDASFKQQLRIFLHERNIFKPELLNRFDDVVVFRPLSQEDVRKITKILLDDLISHMKDKDISLEIEDEAITKIITQGYDKEYGARPIRRYIQDNLDDLIATSILNKTVNRGDAIKISVKNDIFVVERV